MIETIPINRYSLNDNCRITVYIGISLQDNVY